jgi:hypothetical protein
MRDRFWIARWYLAVMVDKFRRDLMCDRFWIACSYLAVIEVKRQEFMSSGVLLCSSVKTFVFLYFFFHLRVIFAFTSTFWDLCMLLLCCPCADEYACKFSRTRSFVVVCGRCSSRFSYEHLMFKSFIRKESLQGILHEDAFSFCLSYLHPWISWS